MKKSILVLSMLAILPVAAQASTLVDGQIVNQKSDSNRTIAASEFLVPDASGTNVGVLNRQSGTAHRPDQVTRVAVPRAGSGTSVPEPVSMLLFATGLFGVAVAARRRTTK